MNSQDILADTPLLGGLPKWALVRITASERRIELPKGDTLFLEGDQGRAVFVLIGGGLRLYRTDEKGREVVMHLVRPGEVFAETILFDEERYPVTAEARFDSEVVEIRKDHVLSLLQDPDFRQAFFAGVMRKLRFLTRQVYVLSSYDVQERLLRFLEGRYGRRPEYETDLSKKEVAAAIATTPETLSRVLKQLEVDGSLVWRHRSIRVDPEVWTSRWDEDVDL